MLASLGYVLRPAHEDILRFPEGTQRYAKIVIVSMFFTEQLTLRGDVYLAF